MTHSTFTGIVSIRIVQGDHLWQRGTTYGAIDGPGRPSMAAVLGPGGPPVAINIATDRPGGPILGGPSVA